MPPRRGFAIRRNAYPYMYVAPALALFVVFLVYPYCFAIYLSLHSWNGLTPIGSMKWVGLGNYARMFADNYMGLVLTNTVVYGVVVTLAENLLGFLLAFGLFHLTSGRLASVLRTAFFYPAIISQVMVGLAWSDLLRRDGVVNTGISLITGQPVTMSWFGSPDTALGAIIWVAIWSGAGWTMVLYLAGLTGIPREILDAAAIDGASTLQSVRHIILGVLRPVISMAVLFNIISNFQTFAIINATTKGGPLHATEVVGTYAYWLAFALNGPQDMGYAATLATLMTTGLFVFALVRVRTTGLLRR